MANEIPLSLKNDYELIDLLGLSKYKNWGDAFHDEYVNDTRSILEAFITSRYAVHVYFMRIAELGEYKRNAKTN